MTTPQPAQPGFLSVRHALVDGVRVVALHGDLDHATRDRAERALVPPDGDVASRTVADLAGVAFMDSSGINALIAAYRPTAATEGWLRIAGAQAPLRRVMELVGLDLLIPCYPTLDQALQD
ncbi:STAS domain-containing protein [Streptomyces sp. NPDC002306]